MASIMVTGGLGAVGTYLSAELNARGHEVWIYDLPHHPGERYIRGDVGDYRQLETALMANDTRQTRYTGDVPRFDMVYHLAAEFGRWNGEDFYETMWRANAIGTKHLLRLQERLGFRAVYFSSSEVYGDYDGVMTEDVLERVPIRQLNDYAISKWVNEQQVMNSADMHGTESVRVRLFNTYGPGEPYSPYRSVICMFIYHALHGLPFTVYRGHQRTSTYITDMARTLANIADHFHPGEVYNIAGTSYHTIEEVAELVIKYTGCNPALVQYTELEPFTTVKKEVECTKAIRDLEHNPQVSLVDGIRSTVDWMRSIYAR